VLVQEPPPTDAHQWEVIARRQTGTGGVVGGCAVQPHGVQPPEAILNPKPAESTHPQPCTAVLTVITRSPVVTPHTGCRNMHCRCSRWASFETAAVADQRYHISRSHQLMPFSL
jgi:hypothetical protein